VICWCASRWSPPNSQFGFLYVEPKSGAPNNDWNLDYASATLGDRTLGHGEPIRVKKGQRVLFRLVNADATRDLNLALPGHKFRVIALDGNPVPHPAEVEVSSMAQCYPSMRKSADVKN
jgi:FtsP/CotA-like multicopper oxidase with cupredoxin domain